MSTLPSLKTKVGQILSTLSSLNSKFGKILSTLLAPNTKFAQILSTIPTPNTQVCKILPNYRPLTVLEVAVKCEITSHIYIYVYIYIYICMYIPHTVSCRRVIFSERIAQFTSYDYCSHLGPRTLPSLLRCPTTENKEPCGTALYSQKLLK